MEQKKKGRDSTVEFSFQNFYASLLEADNGDNVLQPAEVKISQLADETGNLAIRDATQQQFSFFFYALRGTLPDEDQHKGSIQIKAGETTLTIPGLHATGKTPSWSGTSLDECQKKLEQAGTVTISFIMPQGVKQDSTRFGLSENLTLPYGYSRNTISYGQLLKMAISNIKTVTNAN